MRNQTTMRTVRTSLLGLAGLGAAGWVSVSLMAGGQAPGKAPHQMPMPGTGMMTRDQKIAGARLGVRSGDDPRLAREEGEPPTVLRTGRNAWNCLPDMAESQGNDPMCVDQSWMKWIEGYTAHKAPQVMSVGIGYMLAPGTRTLWRRLRRPP